MAQLDHVVAEPDSVLAGALAAWGHHDRDDPFPLYAALRERGPVHEVVLADGHAAWLVVSYDAARAALNDGRLSKDMHAAWARSGEVVAEGLPGRAFARHMLAVDLPDHTRLRKLVAGAFSARRIEALRPHVVEIADDLVRAIEASDPTRPVDLVASLAFPLPYTVICELLGVDVADRAPLGEALGGFLRPTSTPAEYERAKEASDQVVAMLVALVAGKEQQPDDRLVSALLAARDGEERLTQEELLSTILQLIIAGHDTTASLIENTVVALLSHPDQLAQGTASDDALALAIEEVLRFDAPVPHTTFRYATEDLTLGGVDVPAGAQVLICLASANRDGARFADPDALELGRDDARHLAFGHGIHFCIGAALARLEAHIALGALLGRFPELRLAVPRDELHWGHGDGLVLRGLSELPVWVRPR